MLACQTFLTLNSDEAARPRSLSFIRPLTFPIPFSFPTSHVGFSTLCGLGFQSNVLTRRCVAEPLPLLSSMIFSEFFFFSPYMFSGYQRWALEIVLHHEHSTLALLYGDCRPPIFFPSPPLPPRLRQFSPFSRRARSLPQRACCQRISRLNIISSRSLEPGPR